MKTNLEKNQKKYFLTISAFFALGCLLLLLLPNKNSVQIEGSILLKPQVLGENTEKIRGEILKPTQREPLKKTKEPIIPEGISAKAFSVTDEASHVQLFGQKTHLSVPIASLTKLMTALLAYENLNLEDFYEISPNDILNTKPSLGLKAGEEVKIQNLLESSLVCSSNDAAKALANAVQKHAKEDFALLMNQKAKKLGLLETNFSNPLGFDSDYNYSSVFDLFKLTSFTQSLAIFKTLGKRIGISFASKAGKTYTCQATNKLVGKNLEIENIKTGYTPKALGSMIARVSRDGINLIVIVVESQTREKDLLNLSGLAFENFNWF